MSTVYVLQTIRHLDGKISKTWLFSCIMVAKQCVNILGRIRNQECQKKWLGAGREESSLWGYNKKRG